MTAEQIATLIANQLPGLIAFLRERLRRDDPDAPSPTDAEILAALHTAVSASVAKDDAWLAAHPPTPPAEPPMPE